MTTAELGNGDVPVTRMEALASELRLLKSAMSDVQGRLDSLLIEIGNELQSAPVASEPCVEVLEASQAAAEVQEASEAPAAVEIEPALAADADLPSETIEEAAPAVAIEEPVMVEEAVVEIHQIETPVATEAVAQAEAVIEVPAEPQIDTASVEVAQIETITIEVAEVAIEAATIEVQPAAVAEAVVAETPVAVETPVAAEAPVASLPENVVPAEVLAERRNARKARSVVVRVGRWAAVIALIAVCAGLVATGTGFAGDGQILAIKHICASAGDVCAIMPGIP